MNDPNGLVFHCGVYHMFFQYNPAGSTWGNMSWGHASSADLVHWTEHEVAIEHRPTEAIFSGCVVVDHHNSSGFSLTAGVAPLVAIYTSAYGDGRQAQSLAYSVDAGISWERYAGNPVLDRSSTAFRDPKVFWYSTGGDTGFWVMVAVEAEAREALFYRSDDLTRWTLLSAFSAPHPAERHWECPDLFALPVDGDPSRMRWVLVVSVNPGGVAGGSGTRYFIGDFDGISFTAADTDAVVANRQWLDWGRDYYAATSFDNSPRGRRIMIAWMNNWDYAADVPTTPWRGAMSLPRELSLRNGGGLTALVQRPAAELVALDAVAGKLTREAFDLDGQQPLPSGFSYRIDATFEPIDATEFGLDLFVGHGEATRLRYSCETGLLRVDRSGCGETAFSPEFPSIDSAPVALDHSLLRLEIYIDRGSIEVFAQAGAVCLTQQVFAAEEATGCMLVSAGGRTRVEQLVWQPLQPTRPGG